MSYSSLSFGNSISDIFRKNNIIKNLSPYTIEGSFSTQVSGENGIFPIKLRDSAVKDSDELLKKYPEYLEKQYLLNFFGPQDGFGEPISIQDIQNIINNRDTYYTFVSSFYPLQNIVFQLNPVGSEASLSNDSKLAQISANLLKQQFQYRIGQEIREETFGRVNLLDALSDPYEATALLTGNRTLIERNWQISQPDNLVGKGLDLVSRITGVYSPYSWIPGDYFDDSSPVTANEQTTVGGRIVNDLRQAISSIVGFGRPELDPSFNFLQNTGGGQKSVLFNNLEFNKYRPEYRSSQVQAAQTLLGQGIQSIAELGRALGGTQPPAGQYYLGTQQTPIPNLVAPPNDQPSGMDGVPVYGYTILGKTYEGEGLDGTFRFGYAGRSFYNQGDIQGGFSWAGADTTPVGSFVGPNGTTFGGNASSTFGGTVSDGFAFTKDSILDKTQQLVLSNPGGGKAFESIGNAINQVSKIFNDGYKEITKGSKVIKYVDVDGIEQGAEYCRIFTKDQPFTTMSRLQKKTRNIRGFSYSNLDAPYNLNITPTKGVDSTNLTNEGVKKYMFSIENLAWKPSKKKGFTVQDLPLCERGPNGGRIMWFPPYELTFSESLSSKWNPTEFIGRPEPIYTFGNATRSGSLSFKIVVDHPSVLNLIVDKTLKGQNAEETNSILESFFAGCKEYDLYELAALYNTIPLTELQQIQVILNQTTDTTTIEEMISQTAPEPPVVQEQPEPGSPGGSDEVAPPQNPVVLDPVNCEVSCYFRNDYPKPDETVQPFNTYLQVYIGKKQAYVNCAPSAQKQGVGNFFDNAISQNQSELDALCDQIFELCNQNYNVTINLIGNTSSIGSTEYNRKLSERRISSVQQYIEGYKNSQLSKFKDSILKYKSLPEGETNSDSTETGPLSDTVCALQAIENRNVRVQLVADPPPVEPTPETVAVSETPQTDELPNPTDVQNGTIPPQSIPRTVTTTTTTETRQVSALPGLAKKVLRNLLSECSYFEMMKEDSPVIYDSLKEKLKYFHPAFHAITPEGLNSRLTFLNQCTRPGSTIPVINDRGQEVINDAENTSFGAPPVCVLRIGDFYNTKIIINSISLQYENLDINPEGIGIQPMIAGVTVNFDFIGGSGLKEPINQLQNALSFNYYANTEMYDERAEATEDTSEIDNNLYKQIQENQAVKTQGNTSQPNTAGTYIGSVVSTEINDTGFTGTLSYETTINDTKDKVRNYVFALTNNLEAFAVERGWGFMTEMNRLNRFYENGTFDFENVQIYGSPQNVQGRVDTIFTTAKGYFDNDEGYILEWISNTPLKTKTKRTIKKNLVDFINNKKNFVSGNSVLKFNEVNTNQVDMVKNINKLNYITQQTSDGFIDTKGNPTIVTVSLPTIATDSPFKEIVTLSEDLNNFLLSDLQGVGIFDPSPNIEESPEKYYYEYLTLYEDIVELDFRVKLVNTLLTNVDSDQESSARVYLNEIIDKMYSEYGYQLEQKYTETKFKEAFDKINDKFEVYIPFQNSTGFAFGIVQNTSPNSTQIDELKNLYDGVNSGSNDTFNGKENFV
jgi:outer membrane protein OmpA-like peptidoglycan-associated protein